MPSISVVFDSVQTRLVRNEMALLCSGQDWDVARTSGSLVDGTWIPDAWIDPVTKTAMLLPSWIHPHWNTSHVGAFSKYQKADFDSLTNSGSFGEVAKDGGGPFLEYGTGSAGTTGNPGALDVVVPAVPLNQGMVIEFFAPPNVPTEQVFFDFGWSNGISGATGVSGHYYTSGKVDIWKDGAVVGAGYSVNGKQDYAQNPQNPTGAQQPNSQFVSVMLLPCRDRELLVVSSMGGGFCHTFQDLDPSTAGQTITTAEKFWISFKAPFSPCFRLSRVHYATTSATVYGPPSAWRTAPSVGAVLQTRAYKPLTELSGTSVTLGVDTAGPNPYGLEHPARIQATLVGTIDHSPFLLGARCWYPAETADTIAGPDGPIDVTSHVVQMGLSVQSTFGGTRAQLTLNRPGELSTSVPGLTDIENRPVRIYDESGQVLEGVTEPPEVVEDKGATDSEYDLNVRVNIVVRDLAKLAEDHIIAEAFPADGMTLKEFYEALCTTAGRTARVSASLSDYRFPAVPSASHGEWGLCALASDRLSEWLDRLHHSYAANCYHGVAEDGAYELLDATEFGTTPSVHLYRSVKDAVDAGFSEAEAYRHVYRDLTLKWLPVEANSVWVLGVDPFTGRPVVSHYDDTASIAPDVAPEDRAANWIGGRREYSLSDPSLRDRNAVNWALGKMKGRVTKKRLIAEFTCDLQGGLKPNQVLVLHHAQGYSPESRTGTDLTVRVKTFDAEFVQVGDDMDTWRPTRYVGEDIGSNLVAPLGVHGTSAALISVNWLTKMASDANRWRQAVMSTLRPALTVDRG